MFIAPKRRHKKHDDGDDGAAYLLHFVYDGCTHIVLSSMMISTAGQHILPLRNFLTCISSFACFLDKAQRYSATLPHCRNRTSLSPQNHPKRPAAKQCLFAIGPLQYTPENPKLAEKGVIKGLKERPLKGPLVLYRGCMGLYKGYRRVI